MTGRVAPTAAQSGGAGAEDEHIACEVHDAGRPGDPLAGRRPDEAGKPGGRGPLTVNHLAGLVRLHTSTDGTTIRFCLPR